jgi:hypothetical protein
MRLLFDSFWRAFAYCLHPKVIGLSLLPLLVAGVVTLGLNYLFWENTLDWIRAGLESWSLVNSALQWMSTMLGANFRTVLVPLIGIALEIPVVVAFVLVLVALWITPATVTMVANRRFAGLERRHGGSWWKSLFWSLVFTVGALLMVMFTLPFWLVPGMALILPPLIWGWLTARVMGFDALAEHASAAERDGILRAHRWPLLVMGILTGFLCGVPSMIWTLSVTMLVIAPLVLVFVIWVYTLIFTFSALWFTHYALSALATLRAAETAMRAVQPGPATAMPAAHGLPLVEEVPPHERFAPGPDERSSDAF